MTKSVYKFICRKVAAAIRVVAGKKSVETELSKRLSEVNPFIDENFISKTITMKTKPMRNEEVNPENLDEEGF